MGRKRRGPPEVNLLDLIPQRLIDYETGEDDAVTLLAPRFKSRLLKKYLQPRLKRPFLKVELDEIGSAVWLLCDGKQSVKVIADALRERFQEKIEPCYERLGLFMRHLEANRFIRFTNYEACLRERNP